MDIIIDAPLADAQADQINKLSPKIKLVKLPELGKAIPKDVLRSAEVIYTTMADFDPADAPRLRWVQIDTAATNPIKGKPITRSEIPIANVSGAYTVAVAEFAFGILLALTRRINVGLRYQAESHWTEDYGPFCGEDLYGMTMGIVGYGSIGRQIARLASAMGMKVLACKRQPEHRKDDSYRLPGTGDPDGTIPKAWYGQNQIAEMFRQSDIAMITLPDVPATQRMIGKSELAALPRHAYFVNVGRGAVVDEPELIARLQAGALAGAALDVVAEEPLPKSSPLWKMPNVLIMPHVASWTNKQATRACEVLLENVRRDVGGEPLVNVIDKKLMY